MSLLPLEEFLRTRIKTSLIKEKYLALVNDTPSLERLERKLRDIDNFGVYLHIPFCEQICPYCPYNKEIFSRDAAERYTNAVKREIRIYSGLIGDKPVTSLYIGGGTPTTMLHNGMEEILENIFDNFNIECDIHMESHPNHLSLENLKAIRGMRVRYLSIGVEALQENHLRTLKRPYTAEKAKAAIERAVSTGFDCVNTDFIFALPGQTCREIAQTGQALVDMGVDQIAAYPLFRFPYTKMGEVGDVNNYKLSTIFSRRKMLKLLEGIFYGAGLERTSVWAFTKRGIPKYCSVTIPLYIGLGASGGSYLKDIFYLNTFNVSEYCKALEEGRMPISLSMALSEKTQMAGWFYWRIYETRFSKSDFKNRFGKDFDDVYGRYMKPLSFFGFLKDDGDQVVLSDRGTYWLHALEDLLSISYVSKLWGTSKHEPWPKRVVL